jgi:hypothetical protein
MKTRRNIYMDVLDKMQTFIILNFVVNSVTTGL